MPARRACQQFILLSLVASQSERARDERRTRAGSRIYGTRRCGALESHYVLGALPLVLVLAFGELLDDLGAERRQVVGVTTRDESLVCNDLLIHPIAASVADIGLQGGV